jgi:hypothetical protein
LNGIPLLSTGPVVKAEKSDSPSPAPAAIIPLTTVPLQKSATMPIVTEGVPLPDAGEEKEEELPLISSFTVTPDAAIAPEALPPPMVQEKHEELIESSAPAVVPAVVSEPAVTPVPVQAVDDSSMPLQDAIRIMKGEELLPSTTIMQEVKPSAEAASKEPAPQPEKTMLKESKESVAPVLPKSEASQPAVEVKPKEEEPVEEGTEAETEAPAPAPALRKEKSSSGEGVRTHRVVYGENLPRLAQRYYGDKTLWLKIYEANKDKIEKGSLPVGELIIIP